MISADNKLLAGVAVATAAAAIYYFTTSSCKKRCPPKSIKITYFDIAGAAEKLRLACAYYGVDFEDERIQRADWPERKKKMKYGQMPMVTLDGVEHFQSFAVLRFLAKELGDGSLYPCCAKDALKVEELLGLGDDMMRSFMPSLMVAMNPKAVGHVFTDDDKGKAEKAAAVKEMRGAFLKEEIPKYMGFLSTELSTSPFLCGDTPTLADIVLFPQVSNFTKGYIDHIPVTCLEPYPKVTAWMARMAALPTIKAYYGSKK